MSFKFGIYGCEHGHITVFIGELLAMGGTCAGIYDPGRSALAQKLAERYAVPLLDDPSGLADESVKLIGSSAVNNQKIDIIEWCERHGKHIMVDKPAVTGRNGLERLEAVIGRGNIQIGMLLTERFRASTVTLKKAIEAGKLGKIVSITMRKPHKLNPASRPAWHFSKEQNGGIVIDLFVHDFDLLRWLTGQEPVNVQAQMAKHVLPEYPDFYDAASAQVLMSGGTIAQLYSDWHTPEQSWTWGDCRIFVTGTEGCAELRLSGDPSVNPKEELYFQITRSEPFVKVELDKPERNMMQDFLDRIAGKPSVLTHRDILETSRATVIADEQAMLFNAFR